MQEIKNDIILFMFGGNAIFTIVKDNTHYSYKIYRKKTTDGSKIYHLYLRKANKGTYCGYFKITDNRLHFKRSDKYDVPANCDDLIVLHDVIKGRKNLPDNIKVYHSGRCGCCGRILTDPQAMARGFGPECWKKVRTYIE